ncbi:Rv3654c family TadE-like protein [Protaetiibacter mangrovi]|uniref:Helicase n=1 Tax=Protaetiibacter mangrovi TaxID=2970926 RepID=A0ABT1ZFT2_9MICO|nr:Rv3654c family TadE-like protein [Protaetiibacter mangrovi]MCS0499573.1 helicase [Protaetiibacter mangrovi]TPX03443.1 helicase [Schumannella luteola]
MTVSRGGRRPRADAGSGGVLAIAIVGTTVVTALAGLSIGSALAVRQRAVAAADAAALAAADALLGAVPGDPCALAAEVAAAHRVALAACELGGAEARVVVSTEALGVPISVGSRAGPTP